MQTNQLRPPCELVNTAESASFILGLLGSHLRQLGNKKEEKEEKNKGRTQPNQIVHGPEHHRGIPFECALPLQTRTRPKPSAFNLPPLSSPPGI
jgi:hypothetical protein